jgi:hypothetical protein
MELELESLKLQSGPRTLSSEPMVHYCVVIARLGAIRDIRSEPLSATRPTCGALYVRCLKLGKQTVRTGKRFLVDSTTTDVARHLRNLI